jgi:hypothetical protein
VEWEVINMDFIIGLPTNKKKNDFIMVVIDKVTKVAHFIPVKSTYKAIKIAESFIKEIFRFYSLPKTIILEWDTFVQWFGHSIEF